ncbi:MAG: hypothetical protein A2259_00285 [Candidatus Moranbacteria bacterium RIFOXYA2_FULL_43_15]|nr:MAG: hypothetical protein A2259_00285 [Candidatus Moranbacteria bacterium RIFOXYA2_FULL_43_15]
MKKIVTLSALSLGILFLAGCGQQPVSQTNPTIPAPIAQQNEQSTSNPANQMTVPAETLNYCGKSFVAEKMEINGVDIVDRILQLYTTKDKNNCTNFDQIKNIAVLKSIEGSVTRIILYEKEALTEVDRRLPIDKQLEKVFNNVNYPEVNEFDIDGDSIYETSRLDGSSKFSGKIK